MELARLLPVVLLLAASACGQNEGVTIEVVRPTADGASVDSVPVDTTPSVDDAADTTAEPPDGVDDVAVDSVDPVDGSVDPVDGSVDPVDTETPIDTDVCAEDGGLCAEDGDCCGALLCDPAAHVCTACLQNGTPCTSDGCCSGLCDAILGECGSCYAVGNACADDGQCCTAICIPSQSGPGLTACATCRPEGAPCTVAAAGCCAPTLCDALISQCASCKTNGNTCSSDQECCGYCVGGSCADCRPQGSTCAGHGECCNAHCNSNAVCAPEPTTGSGWTRPLAGYNLTQCYHDPRYGNPAHNGVDLAKAAGSGVYAAHAGTVTEIIGAWQSGYGMTGNRVVISHDGSDVKTIYDHVTPAVGYQHVAMDQLIGHIDMSGSTTGAHLHFTVWQHGRAVEPICKPYEPFDMDPDNECQWGWSQCYVNDN